MEKATSVTDEVTWAEVMKRMQGQPPEPAHLHEWTETEVALGEGAQPEQRHRGWDKEKLGLQRDKHSHRRADDKLETEAGPVARARGLQASFRVDPGASEGCEQQRVMARAVLLWEDEDGVHGGRTGGEQLEVWFLCFLNGTVSHQVEPAQSLLISLSAPSTGLATE